jgi:hypothetical protein
MLRCDDDTEPNPLESRASSASEFASVSLRLIDEPLEAPNARPVELNAT